MSSNQSSPDGSDSESSQDSKSSRNSKTSEDSSSSLDSNAFKVAIEGQSRENNRPRGRIYSTSYCGNPEDFTIGLQNHLVFIHFLVSTALHLTV